jgi:hypothetical protein
MTPLQRRAFLFPQSSAILRKHQEKSHYVPLTACPKIPKSNNIQPTDAYAHPRGLSRPYHEMCRSEASILADQGHYLVNQSINRVIPID